MKYSEAKAIISCLRYNGWRKFPGVDEYWKTWNKGDLRYRQCVTFFELTHLNYPIKEFIEWYDKKAEREFRKKENKI